MEFLVVKDAKDFLNEPCGRISPTPVGRTEIVLLTRDTGTDASTADIKNVSPWE